MLSCSVNSAIRNGYQTTDGAGEYDFTRTFFIHEFANNFLCECQRSEEVRLERAFQKFHWNLRHWATDTNGCVIDEDVDVPIQGVFNVVRIENVKFLNAKVFQT